jgi:hypothetical protein
MVTYAARLPGTPNGVRVVLDLRLVLSCAPPALRQVTPSGPALRVAGGRSHPSAFSLVIFEFAF